LFHRGWQQLLAHWDEHCMLAGYAAAAAAAATAMAAARLQRKVYVCS
jgi:hypothetical protein